MSPAAQTRLQSIAPFITLALVLALWAMAIRFANLPGYLLPAPHKIVMRVWDGLFITADMWPHILATMKGVVLGYGAGLALGVGFAVLFDAIKPLERLLSPIIVGLWAMPKVALAPIILIWFGLGLESIAILVALICMFPIFINMLTGLKSVDHNLLELYRGYGAGPMHVLWHLKLPSALPHLMAGMQISVAFALVGTCVMEFTIGTSGLGFMIEDSSNRLDTVTGVAAMVVLGLLGAIGSLSMRALRKRLTFWERTS